MPGTSAAATCTRRLSGAADHLAENDMHALALARGIVGTLNALAQGSRRRAARARSRSGRRLRPSCTASSCWTPKAGLRGKLLRRARGDRPRGGRLRVRGVQGAPAAPTPVLRLRVDRGHVGGHRRQQRHPVRRERRTRAPARRLEPAAASARCCWCSRRTSPASAVGRKYENEGIARAGALMRRRRCVCANVPKFTVIIGGLFGAGNYGMLAAARTARASCGCGPTRASA